MTVRLNDAAVPEVRMAQPGDLEPMSVLASSLGTEWIEAMIRNPVALVAYLDGKLAGYVLVRLNLPLAVIESIGIDPAFKRQNVGTCLVEGLHQLGYTTLAGYVHEDDAASRTFWSKTANGKVEGEPDSDGWLLLKGTVDGPAV